MPERVIDIGGDRSVIVGQRTSGRVYLGIVRGGETTWVNLLPAHAREVASALVEVAAGDGQRDL